MLEKAETVQAAKGKKLLTWKPNPDNREEILKAVIGPSGNLRVPTLKIGKRYLVGFSPELYQIISSIP